MLIVNHDGFDYGIYFNHDTTKKQNPKKRKDLTECVIQRVPAGQWIKNHGVTVAIGKSVRTLEDRPNRKIGNIVALKRATANLGDADNFVFTGCVTAMNTPETIVTTSLAVAK